MNRKIAVLAFRGQRSCFLHALLNVLDLKERGENVVLILEGESPVLLKEITKREDPMYELYQKTRDVISAVCYACSKMVGTLETVEKEGLPVSKALSGHVRLSEYLEAGYEFITF